jgi:hypothetical protein
MAELLVVGLGVSFIDASEGSVFSGLNNFVGLLRSTNLTALDFGGDEIWASLTTITSMSPALANFHIYWI